MVATEPELTGLTLEGRYQVGELLAVGGMSRVYRGTDTRLGRAVAVKVMDARLAADPRFRGRFEREARAIAAIDHPGVVGVYDQGEHGGPPRPVVFLVMELVVGGTLRDVLTARGSLDVPTALAVLEPVLAALAAAHAQRLTHRDVKPENVLISRTGAVKVADFGLVTAAAQAQPSTAGMIVGTVAYLSPEQVEGRPVDARSDVYAAGVMLYELLTGVPPYDGDHPLAVAYRHVNEDVPPPSALVPGLPPELDALVASATRRDPAARPPDAATLLHALLGVRAALGVPRVPVPAPDSDVTRRVEPVRATAREVPRAPGARPRATRALTALTPADGAAPGGGAPGGAAQGGAARGGAGQGGRRAGDGAPPRARSAAPPSADPGAAADHLGRRRRSRRMLAVWLGVVLLLGLLIATLAYNAGAGHYTDSPKVLGMDEQGAVGAERAAGLVPVVVRKQNDTIPAGRVAVADPAGGQRVAKGSTVTLTVSTGRPTVPDIPSGSSRAQAEQILKAAGLTPSSVVSNRSDPSAPRGTVVGTSPAAGTAVSIGAPVGLVLSSGPEDEGRDGDDDRPRRRDRSDDGDDPGRSLTDEIERRIHDAFGG
ncbi:MAG TPA: Stk1 family PASTA domain-containing Ser/Thr kinase [Pseudonocardia sp.]